MKRFFQFLVVMCLITLQLSAQVKYTSKEGNFTASFPSKPKLEVSDLDGGTKFYQLECLNGEEMYMLFFSSYNEKADKAKGREICITAKNAFVDKLGAEIKSAKVFDYKGNTGDELVLETADGFKVYYRILYIDRTLYQFAVITASPKISEINSFFNSFKYTGK